MSSNVITKKEYSPNATTQQAAEFLSLSAQSLKQSRVSGELCGVQAPKFLKMGRTVRYKKETLIQWLEQFDEQSNFS